MYIPFPEYPRPLLQRENWLNLNGLWHYAFTDTADTPAAWEGEILVPYSPESKASGVEKQLKPDGWLHYQRSFPAPAGAGGRVLLHFGAVDYACAVEVNGRLVGGHRGGYLPFTLDITDAVKAEDNILTVHVQDPSDTGHQARGKQKLQPGGMYYTAQSGIWQTVWAERVPETYVAGLKITPLFDQKRIRVRVDMSDPSVCSHAAVNVVLRREGEVIAEEWTDETGNAELLVMDKYFRPWSPEDPFLYELSVTTSSETVTSYAALRKFSKEKDKKGLWRFYLNNKPFLPNGLLDQGYWPDGLYTPSSDEAMVLDIQTMKDLGFNMLRKHIKIEPQRWYYHCDRLGMVVWQDMVNGGGKYADWFVTYAINVAPALIRSWPDSTRRLLARTDEAGRAEYTAELEAMVRLLYSHPCIGCWVPFNEGWGQFDARKATALVRKLDDTRLIDEASGWFDQGGGDLYSIHNYFYKLKVKPKADRIVALTEYGGIAWPMPGHTTTDKTYGYGTAQSRQELTRRYEKLMLDEVKPWMEKGLSALVYTQISDIQDEVNGIFTYDRTQIKPEPDAVKACNQALYDAFEKAVM